MQDCPDPPPATASTEPPLRAPFPYFGGKSRVADVIWARFGDVTNYVEPFAGSLAVLLARPHAPRVETVNDRDAHVANYWRAVTADPDAVASYADWPVNEVDLHARHQWLVTTGAERVARLEHDPDYYDVQAAGWWVWGICTWIAGGWCQVSTSGSPARRLPHLSSAGLGIHRPGDHATAHIRLPHSLPHLGTSRGIHRDTVDLIATFRRLSARLRRVRVTCGNWTRVTGDSVTWRHGITGILLDPPYVHAGRSRVYAVDDDVADEVRAWAVQQGENPLLRMALCGYEGDYDMPSTWTPFAWKAAGGYGSQGQGRGRENAARERIWFSPHCLPAQAAQGDLFQPQE